MPQRIDHVIALGNDLDALEAAFTRLGFAVVGGGTHPHLGTRNRIILLGEGYLELLALGDPERASPILTRRLPNFPGWVGFALQSNDLTAETQAIASRGADVQGPHAGQLVAPDGRARSWQVATLGSSDLWAAAEPVPFLIQHDTSGEQHRTELAGWSDVLPNPNGAVGIAEIAIAVRDLTEAADRFAVAYGLRPEGTSTARSEASLQAETLELPLPSGERIVLAEPTGDGPVAQRLDQAGEGLCRVTLAAADLKATERWLAAHGISFTRDLAVIAFDAAQSGGAPLAFVQAK